MEVTIHSFHLDTVRSILDEKYCTQYKESMVTGSTVILVFVDDTYIREMQMWLDHAKSCELIYVGEVHVI